MADADDDAPALDDPGEEAGGEDHQGLAVEADHLPLPPGIGPDEGAVGAEAGVGDQVVHRRPATAELVDQAVGAAGGAEVEGDHHGGDAVGRGEAPGEGLEAVAGAGGEDQVAPSSRELAGELLPEAGGGAGDEGPAISEEIFHPRTITCRRAMTRR